MKFSKTKLPPEELARLDALKVQSVVPFSFLIGPAYLYFKANEKFVSVKNPLDFFTAEELKRLSPFEHFYMPRVVSTFQPIQDAGLKARSLLLQEDQELNTPKPRDADEVPSLEVNKSAFPEVFFAPSPFQISDSLLQIIGPLWWHYAHQGTGVDPYLVTVFVNELCQLLPADLLIRARERDVERMEYALHLANWVVFLSLHLGYNHLEFLCEIRAKLFAETMGLAPQNVAVDLGEGGLEGCGDELEELIQLAYQSLPDANTRFIPLSLFKKGEGRAAQKLRHRLERVRKELYSKSTDAPSVYGKHGFIDV